MKAMMITVARVQGALTGCSSDETALGASLSSPFESRYMYL